MHSNISSTKTVPTIYSDVPKGSTNMYEIIDLISNRYKILKQNIEGNSKDSLKTALQKSKFSWADTGEDPNKCINNDIISHLYLLLALCDKPTELEWFSRMESKLFAKRVNICKLDVYGTLKKLGAQIKEIKDDFIEDEKGRKIRVDRSLFDFKDTKERKFYYIKFLIFYIFQII